MTSRTGSTRRILGDFEIVSWDETCLGRRHKFFFCVGGDEKARIERLCLSPYVEEPLNPKVIKKVRTWTEKSLRVFSNFEIPMFYLFGHSMDVSHIAVSGYGTWGLPFQRWRIGSWLGLELFLSVFNWNHFEMRLFNLRINFFFLNLLRTFCPHRGAIDNNYRRQYLLEIRLQDSAFLSEVSVNHLKKAKGEIWPKHREEETK